MSKINIAPLRVRDFQITIASLAISVFGDGLTTVAVVFAVLETTGSASDVGFVLSAGVLAQAGLLLVGGAIADRFQRNRVMAFAQLACGACQVTLASLLLVGQVRLWALMACYAGLGCAQAMFRPATSGLVQEIVDATDLPAANGLLSIAQGGAFILGPALGGVVVAVGRPGMAIAIDAATFFVSAALLLRLGTVRRQLGTGKSSLLGDLKEGWAVVRSRSWVWGTIVLFGVFQFAVLGGLGVLGPLLAREKLGGPGVWGAMLSAAAAGALAGGALALRWRPRRLLVGANVSVLGAVPVLVTLSLAAPEGWEVGAMLLYGCATSYADALWMSAIQANIPAGKISRVSSYDWLGSTALYPLGLALAGPVAAVISASSELRGAAVIMILGVIVLLSVPGVRRVGIPEGGQEEVRSMPAEKSLVSGGS
jgi:Transmembrane secretion effector